MIFLLLQSILDGLASLLHLVVGILPSSPFRGVFSFTLDNQLLSFLAWLVPYPQMIAVLEAWGVAIGVFYLQMVILRWVKAIE